MPTVLIIKGLRFFFFSNDHRPIHVHVSRGKRGPSAKIELEGGAKLVFSRGFSKADTKKILNICEEAREDFIALWEDYFEEEE